MLPRGVTRSPDVFEASYSPGDGTHVPTFIQRELRRVPVPSQEPIPPADMP